MSTETRPSKAYNMKYGHGTRFPKSYRQVQSEILTDTQILYKVHISLYECGQYERLKTCDKPNAVIAAIHEDFNHILKAFMFRL
jgi:hypothetical protein